MEEGVLKGLVGVGLLVELYTHDKNHMEIGYIV